MHETFFGVKRVHLLFVKFARLLLKDIPLTPARFDMMRIVHVHDVEGVGVPQGNIRLLLGVSAATVSRMLKALEELGFIARTRIEHDARCLEVRLTRRGRDLIEHAMAKIIYSGWIDTELDETVVPFPEHITAFATMLDFFRDVFEDPAPFVNPWRCGQLDHGWPDRFFNPPISPFSL